MTMQPTASAPPGSALTPEQLAQIAAAVAAQAKAPTQTAAPAAPSAFAAALNPTGIVAAAEQGIAPTNAEPPPRTYTQAEVDALIAAQANTTAAPPPPPPQEPPQERPRNPDGTFAPNPPPPTQEQIKAMVDAAIAAQPAPPVMGYAATPAAPAEPPRVINADTILNPATKATMQEMQDYFLNGGFDRDRAAGLINMRA